MTCLIPLSYYPIIPSIGLYVRRYTGMVEDMQYLFLAVTIFIMLMLCSYTIIAILLNQLKRNKVKASRRSVELILDNPEYGYKVSEDDLLALLLKESNDLNLSEQILAEFRDENLQEKVHHWKVKMDTIAFYSAILIAITGATIFYLSAYDLLTREVGAVIAGGMILCGIIFYLAGKRSMDKAAKRMERIRIKKYFTAESQA